MCKNKPFLKVTVSNGKYTVIQEADGSVKVLRYDAIWKDATGDGLILALAQEIERLQKEFVHNCKEG